MIRPAAIATVSGAKGEMPWAIKSALMNDGQLASSGRNSLANVVFPAPLGPAMMMIFLDSLMASVAQETT